MAKRTAIIDIGSNSVRMIILEKSSRYAFHLIHESKSKVRISENAYHNNNNLQSEPQERAYQALKNFSSILKEYKATKTICVATSALRDAPNKQEFIQRIRQDLKLNIKVINGEKEAYFGGLAAANLLHLNSAITLDIGGGSTEISFYNDKKISQNFSLNLGTVRLKELYFDNDDINGAKKYIQNELQKLPLNSKHHIVGIGGTLRALAQLIMNIEAPKFRKLHGFSFDLSEYMDLIDNIIKASKSELKNFGVKKERYDVIRPGLLILKLLIEHMNITHMTASGVGVREGVYLHDLLRSSNHLFPHNFNPSIKNLQDRFITTKSSVAFASKLFDTCQGAIEINSSYKEIFLNSVKLSQIGERVDYYEAHRHAFYLIVNGLHFGVSHEDIILIATLVRFQRKNSPSDVHYQSYKDYLPNINILQKLSYLNSITQIISQYNGNVIPKTSIANNRLKIENLSYLTKEKLKDIKNDILELSL